MSADNEKLWIVRRYANSSTRAASVKTFVFRTRYAAREFVDKMRSSPRNRATYTAPQAATWGPEA